MTEAQLDELERLDKAASTGWHKTFKHYCPDQVWKISPQVTFGGCMSEPDADLICALRNACPALLSLARIGLAAVEKHQVPNLSDPDLEGREYLERFDKVSAAWDKLNRLIDAYLARKDG